MMHVRTPEPFGTFVGGTHGKDAQGEAIFSFDIVDFDAGKVRRTAIDFLAHGVAFDPLARHGANVAATFEKKGQGGAVIDLAFRSRAERVSPLVVLCDISGSMSDYTRVFLHFLHVLTDQRKHVHTFLFGTRLTNVTRSLRTRDIDEALAQCSAGVADWAGGTRIGATLHEFNRVWSRRVLGQGAMVLLFTDGLEREGVAQLGKEMERLRKSCRRLVWLNPLLRFSRFEPRAAGILAARDEIATAPAVEEKEACRGYSRLRSGRCCAPCCCSSCRTAS